MICTCFNFFFKSFFLDTVVREIIVFLSLEDFCFDGLEITCSEFLGENLENQIDFFKNFVHLKIVHIKSIKFQEFEFVKGVFWIINRKKPLLIIFMFA